MCRRDAEYARKLAHIPPATTPGEWQAAAVLTESPWARGTAGTLVPCWRWAWGAIRPVRPRSLADTVFTRPVRDYAGRPPPVVFTCRACAVSGLNWRESLGVREPARGDRTAR
jgi:hypothetical protein